MQRKRPARVMLAKLPPRREDALIMQNRGDA